MALVSFDRFSLAEGSPIYSQIIRFIKAGIVAGTIADGDEFPSRRALSALLGVNPNTIQKACRLLEEEGLLPDESTGEIAGLPPFFNESGEWLLTRGAQQGVLGWIDLYDPETHRREARGMLCKTGQATLLATEDFHGTAAHTYRKNALAQWLDVHMNGETA